MAQGVCMSEDKPTKQKKEVDLADFVQRTLVIFKPDSVQRGIVGEILQRFERVGLKIVGMKMVSPDQVLFKRHYEDIGKLISRRGEETFMYNLNYMMSGPIIAMCLEGVEAVALVRKIRGDFSHMSFGYSNAKKIGVPNLVHASGNPEEAAEEVKLWFTNAELYDYEDLNEKYTR